MNNRKKIFFSGLNELRALAALGVLFHHVELYKLRLGYESFYGLGYYFNVFISRLGENGVMLFFVLSGFLITYLLLEEKTKVAKISISKFYGRRVLRIWPLYFIILIVGFLIIPFLYKIFPDFFQGQKTYNIRIENLNYQGNLVLYIFFMSNIAKMFYAPVSGSAQSWSVSVEEQFYLVWPWVIKLFSKFLFPTFILILTVANNFRYFMPDSIIDKIISISHIDYMTMGALFAYFYRNYKSFIADLFKSNILIVLVLLVVLVHLFFSISVITKSLAFALLILLVIETNFKVEILDYLGKLSYGIYMYHPLVLYVSFALLDNLDIKASFSFNILIYILVIGVTILISYVSYNYFELFFLKIKSKFSPVLSGN